MALPIYMTIILSSNSNLDLQSFVVPYCQSGATLSPASQTSRKKNEKNKREERK